MEQSSLTLGEARVRVGIPQAGQDLLPTGRADGRTAEVHKPCHVIQAHPIWDKQLPRPRRAPFPNPLVWGKGLPEWAGRRSYQVWLSYTSCCSSKWGREDFALEGVVDTLPTCWAYLTGTLIVLSVQNKFPQCSLHLDMQIRE